MGYDRLPAAIAALMQRSLLRSTTVSVLLVLFALFVICFSYSANAQTTAWELNNDSIIQCAMSLLPTAHGTLSVHSCYMSVHLLDKGRGWLFKCYAHTQYTTLNANVTISLELERGDCRPLFAPSSHPDNAARYSGSYAEATPEVLNTYPPETPVSGGIAYWSAQSASWEVFVCVRMPSGETGCFPVSYNPSPLK